MGLLALPAPAQTVVIQEILYDPAQTYPDGDANGDGAASITQDEFVELLNPGVVPVDITGWTLQAGTNLLFTFPACVVTGGTAVVVFSGGTPAGFLGAAQAFTAGSPWPGLPNPGAVVSLRDGAITNSAVDYTPFPDNLNESITRYPEGTGTVFVAHSSRHPCGYAWSPGFADSGQPYPGAGVTNAPPCLPPLPFTFVQPGWAVVVPVQVVDPEGQPPAPSLTNLPATAVFTDLGLGSGRLDYTGTVADAGLTFTVRVSVVDGPWTVTRTFDLYVVAQSYAGLVINELLPDPNAGGGVHVDSNADGVNSTVQDEFVEVVNGTTGSLDLAGFQLHDGSSLRHVFDPRRLPPGGSMVVFGGGSIQHFVHQPAQVVSQGGVDGLGLANTGDRITLYSPATTMVDQVTYAAAPAGVSLTRYPDFTGGFTNHLQALAHTNRASPGRRVQGTPFLTNQPPLLVPIGPRSVPAGQLLTLALFAYDPADFDPITLSASNGPPGSSLSATGGLGTWSYQPGPAEAGQSFAVTFYAADGQGADSNTVEISVLATGGVERVWINEIHYDNEGADEEEGFELAGTVGTDLSRWYLLPYDGDTLGPELSRSNQLSGTFDNEVCGYGAVWVPFGLNQVENDTEAIALIRDGEVVQFLSYEGSFTAASGPAAGLTSMDIGVDEDPPVSAGHALQLAGTGLTYAAFAWQPAAPHSRGSLNPGQDIPACSAGLNLQKSVYAGHDGGASAPGSDEVDGRNGDPITYVFVVANTGAVALSQVALSDTRLPGFSALDLGSLAAGQSVTALYETGISGDLTNLAEVVGQTLAGTVVTAMDTCVVAEAVPALILQQTVYRGHDAGATCPGSAFLAVTSGSPVTFCFAASNTGNRVLAAVTLADSLPGGPGTTALGNLDPGQVASVYLEAVITGDFPHVASVQGTPPAGPPVSATATVRVDVVTASLQVAKTVYAGHDGGAGCPGADFLATTNGTPLTYCFNAWNDGETDLTNVVLTDVRLGLGPLDLGPLAAGQATSVHHTAYLAASLTNDVTVSAWDALGSHVLAGDSVEVRVVAALTLCGTYTVVDLGTLGGLESRAYGINDKAEIVGEAQVAQGEWQAFLWQTGRLTRLVTGAETSSVAYGINWDSVAVGNRLLAPSGPVQGFHASNGVVTAAVIPTGSYLRCEAINGSHEVAGWITYTNSSYVHPYIRRNGQIIDLGMFDPAYSGAAYSLNDMGQVVGYAFNWCPIECWDPFLWYDANTNGQRDYAELIHLGSLGGRAGYAYDINNLGQVVGWSYTNGFANSRAFLVTPVQGQWDHDNDIRTRTNAYMVSLGTLGGSSSAASAINDAGDIVGSSTLSNGTSHAFLYSVGRMMDLNSLICTSAGWRLEEAQDINNSGQIVGYGVVSGRTRGFLLNPNTGMVEVLRLTRQVQDGGSHPVVNWRGRGQALRYTLEQATALTGSAWSVVAPTNQWPVPGLFWTSPEPAGPTATFYRVRAIAQP